MSKAVINNEIILLRKFAEQARVHTVKKLTRDAFKLRQKKGTDAQKAKNSRKADRIGAEILAIKKVKKDEITKHALTNTINLTKVLQDQNSTPLIRILARIANHKKFSQKIDEFKKKYPNYVEFLGPGRKMKAKLERKEKLKEKSNDTLQKQGDHEELADDNSNTSVDEELDTGSTAKLASDNSEDEDEKQDEEEVVDSEVEDNEEDNSDSEASKSEDEREDENKNGKLKTIKTKPKLEKAVTAKVEVPDKTVNKSLKKQKAEKKVEAQPTKATNQKKKDEIPKIISKQAIVKKFTEIISNENSNSIEEEIDTGSNKQNLTIEKEVDSFFVTKDYSNYLSVAQPKSKNVTDEEEEHDNFNRFKRKFSQEHNSRARADNSFNKFSKYDNDNSRFNNKRNSRFNSNDKSKFNSDENRNSKFNSRKPDSRWEGHQKNMKPYNNEWPRDKGNARMNGESRKDSKPFENRSKAPIENKGNEILHPSWEAKRKQQEALKKGFQGKKIVFGDDL